MQILVDNSLYKAMKKDQDDIVNLVARLVASTNVIYKDQVKVLVNSRLKGIRFKVEDFVIADDQLCRKSQFGTLI